MRSPKQPVQQRNLAAATGAAIVSFVCLFSHLGALGLVGPDEPRYVWIARAVAQTGDWVTPTLYGKPWFEKPALYYWAAAIGFRLHLPAEWAARLPSAFAALAAAIAIGWLGWKHYGSGEDWLRAPWLLAPAIFYTSVASISFARAATPDMLFATAITLAMACAASVLRHNGDLRGPEDSTSPAPAHSELRDLTMLALFGAFLGLGVLAKGPAAVILAGGAIGIWSLATRKWRAAFRLAHPIGIATFGLVGLPWYVICARRNPDFLHVFVFQHNFERYLTPVFQHKQPFWFFVPITLLALLPWTVFLIGSLQEGLRLWREKSWAASPGFFFACWGIFPIVFFSFSESKLPSYILPAVPALGLIASVGAIRAFERSRSGTPMICAGTSLVWIGLAIFFIRAMRTGSLNGIADHDAFLLVAVIALTAGIAVALGFAAVRRDLRLVVGVCCLSVLGAVEIANTVILPALDPAVSARPYEETLQHDLHPERIFEFQVTRAWDYGLAFYFCRELPEWSPQDPNAALVLTDRAGFAKIVKDGRFHGELEPPRRGIFLVPIEAAPR
ncbi:MAG: glycosyltransferase family 39 protein [Candidatus Acidiferrales bacterium]